MQQSPTKKATPQAPDIKPEPTPERILQMAWGFAPALILETAVNFGVFDLLDESPATADELASRTGTSVRGMRSILNALVGLEFLARARGKYELTPESASFLVSTRPGYHGGFFKHTVNQLIPQWMGLKECVRTGHPVKKLNDESDGEKYFAEFVEALFPLNYRAAQALGEYLEVPYATSRVSVLDVGAGSGVWGIALAHQSPQVRIHAVDWPKVLELTRGIAERHGLGDRLTTAPGDLLEADFGKNHHIAAIGHILHSEGAGRSRQLLRRVFEALAPGGTVAIGEFVPNDERTGPANTLIFAVNMLIHTDQGDTFTFQEVSGWLREVGFVNPRLLEVPGPSPLILATKP